MRTFHWTAAFLALAGAACASGGKSVQSNATVLVYNIHAGKDAKGVDAIERVAQVIRDTKADIVLLQEVDKNTARSGNVDQPARFKELTGMNVAFGKSLDYQGGDYGIAILSRWPISSDTTFHLVVSPAQLRSGVSYEPRVALQVTTQSPFGVIRVINTHLDASGTDSFRIQEIPTVLRIANEKQFPSGVVSSVPDCRETCWRTTLIGGDFNSEPDSRVHAQVVAAGWRDGFAECGKGSGLSWPDDKPRKRIDYLYLHDTVHCTDATVLDTHGSDHRPVLFHIAIPPNSVGKGF